MKPERRPHLEMQKRYFDQRVDFFCQPIPESIKERTGQIVASAGLEADSTVLDVGTGIGVLVGHFLAEGVQASRIVGCDLSSRMLAQAKKKYPEVHFWLGDIVDLSIPLPRDFPGDIKSFSFVFFNACFGNMFDQVEALKAASVLTRGRGTIVISHPLGAGFVDSLHRSEPEIVPHLLPDLEDYQSWAETVGYRIDHFDDRPGFYLARLVCNRDERGD
ncbi:MAG: class I SAM-dependent methyltransferase [Candidatus Melainabacteria bacterium]|nr:class I SAM-dependent methyltransferase [Candidatus Melainabacteria bacterium]